MTLRSLYLAAISLLLLGASTAYAQAAPDVTFTVTAVSQGPGKAVPTLTWSTTSPAPTSCTASGSTAWTGTKPASGTLVLPAITVNAAYTLSCTWPTDSIATVSWVAPTQNTDGSPLTDLGGFRILWGKSATALDQTVYLQDPLAKSWVSPTLTLGAWYFGVVSFNALGIEGSLSNVATKTIVAGGTVTKNAAVVFPGTVTFSVK